MEGLLESLANPCKINSEPRAKRAGGIFGGTPAPSKAMEGVLEGLGLPEELRTKVNVRLEYLSADDKALNTALQEFVSTPPEKDHLVLPYVGPEYITGEIACPKLLQFRTWCAGWTTMPYNNTLIAEEAVFEFLSKVPIKLRNYNNLHGVTDLFINHIEGSNVIEVFKYYAPQ